MPFFISHYAPNLQLTVRSRLVVLDPLVSEASMRVSAQLHRVVREFQAVRCLEPVVGPPVIGRVRLVFDLYVWTVGGRVVFDSMYGRGGGTEGKQGKSHISVTLAFRDDAMKSRTKSTKSSMPL